jgi:hypothetical protein
MVPEGSDRVDKVAGSGAVSFNDPHSGLGKVLAGRFLLRFPGFDTLGLCQ